MRCEYCTRKLGYREIAHGIRFGSTEEKTEIFIPDRESAATVLCQTCGEKLLHLIYQKLSKPTYL